MHFDEPESRYELNDEDMRCLYTHTRYWGAHEAAALLTQVNLSRASLENQGQSELPPGLTFQAVIGGIDKKRHEAVLAAIEDCLISQVGNETEQFLRDLRG
jgi:hypothetical protein